MIELDDPRAQAAREVIEAMHKFFKLQPHNGAVQWIEDDTGRVVIFTRGEYRHALMGAVDALAPSAACAPEFIAIPEQSQ